MPSTLLGLQQTLPVAAAVANSDRNMHQLRITLYLKGKIQVSTVP